MGRSIDEIRAEVLALSIPERAFLAHELIYSLDEPDDAELSPEQEAEIQHRLKSIQEGTAVEYELSPEQEAKIQRRIKSIEEGTATGRPVEEVLAEIEEILSHDD